MPGEVEITVASGEEVSSPDVAQEAAGDAMRAAAAAVETAAAAVETAAETIDDEGDDEWAEARFDALESALTVLQAQSAEIQTAQATILTMLSDMTARLPPSIPMPEPETTPVAEAPPENPPNDGAAAGPRESPVPAKPRRRLL